ncbi:BsuPI-related putative proteinase inhibitor [Planococcus sp. CAU13]|uniref:BsuPI-related putative proteinase inhibitor n=1 Tax=Planococcus sp. CAU13 TaxID=1541197 RepID=UPI00052FF22B|nr:BsuPI-related putative proteinase inhibitor [Planococcus sp. CAU13]
MKTGKALAWLLLLTVALLLAGCGTSPSAEPDKGSASSGASEKGEVSGMLKQVEDNLYLYTVDNQTEDALNFEFTSGQRFDFTLSNESGEELYRMSSVSMFIQALGEETLEPGGKLEYEFEVPAADLGAGDYQLKAWLTPKDGEAYPAEMQITVE